MKKQGVIVGCDEKQEWLLSWWWKRYRRHNDFPVAFFDFGMSERARSWCKERGEVIALEHSFIPVASPVQVSTAVTTIWESLSGTWFWDCRSCWFQKPIAMAHTPFERTLWLDLDCEVCGSLKELMNHPSLKTGIAMAIDQNFEYSSKIEQFTLFGERMYNSGVVLFDRHSSLFPQWIQKCIEANGEFRGDQEVFSRLIFTNQVEIDEIPEIYNWPFSFTPHLQARIVHWFGPNGKQGIRQIGGVSDILSSLHRF